MDDCVASGQLLEPAEEPHADALGAELVGLVADCLRQQPEQAGHLFVGPGPVLAAERVQREHRDAAPDRVAQQLADRLDPGGVPLEVGLAAGARPAAVAVHDDRDVAGQLLRRQERSLGELGRGRHGIGRIRRPASLGERRRVGGTGERAIERRLGH